MRELFRVDTRELIMFAVCGAIFAAIVFAWNLSGVADSDMSFIRNNVPLIGTLPPQSISKFVVAAALYVMALVFALISLAAGPYRRALPQIAGLGILGTLAWLALNYWVIAGFLNTSVLYGVVAVVLLGAWMAGVMRFVFALHDPLAAFLVRYGLGLSLFITIVQIVAVLTAGWRTPTQGIPVLYNVTLNAMVGLILAGIGGNMLWRDRRAQLLATPARRR